MEIARAGSERPHPAGIWPAFIPVRLSYYQCMALNR
jgi:hypothetical protein